MSREQIRARESRWAVPAGIAALLGVVLVLASGLVSAVSGHGEAEILRSVHDHSGSVFVSGVMQALGFALFALPIAYLFRAVEVRSERLRAWVLWLALAAVALFAVSFILRNVSTNEAADSFIAGKAQPTLTKAEAREDCVSERKNEGASFLAEEYEPEKGETPLAACESRKLEDDAAANALSDASLASAVSILQVVGGLGFAISLFYVCLWAMRTGLLSRFWGALGMASGIALLLGPLSLVTMVWLIYLGLLLLGAVPGGRPPAWEAGEAVPWPTPGEKAATELEPDEAPEAPPAPTPAEPGENTAAEPGEKRKRKQRD